MDSILIIYPAIAMFTLTMACFFNLGWNRYRAIHNKEVKISFFRTYNEGEQPPRLHLLGRHIQNHFEVPPLFYAGVILIYATGSVTRMSLALAWLYVGTRLVHTYIHLGKNNVSYRFFTFGFSLLVLCGLWLSLLVSIAN